VIDPYPSDNELPYEDIFKSLMKSRTPVIIERGNPKRQIDSQEILSIMSKTHNRLIDFNVVIPMAGKGSRFVSANFENPKPLIEAKGKTLVERSIDSLGLSGKFIFITRSFDDSRHNKELTKLFDRPASNNFVEVRVDDDHMGAAHSASFSEKYLDKNMPLIITNCDQQMYWDPVKFQKFIVDNDPEGVLVVTKSNDPGNSYAIFNEETLVVSRVAEKKVISDYALVGIHYWKNPKDFYASFRQSLETYEESGYPEAYVSITYNELIVAGRKIMAYVIDTEEFVPLGTPEQLAVFLGKNRVAS
jgi:NDP-sugar pyrophosphorylase family protein